MSSELLAAIRQYSTCQVCNAIERLQVRLRNEGFARPGLQWMFPSLPPMLGYACTSRIKTSNSPPDGRNYLDRTDWWRELIKVPGPRIAVVEDVDDSPGFGAVAGETHSAILRRLGCVGLAANGAVRDLAALEAMGFPVLACGTSPSHAYAHVVDFGLAVDIRGLRIHPGDLIFADRHGMVSIPKDLAPKIPPVVEEQRAKERRIIDLCRSPEFTLERLREEVG